MLPLPLHSLTHSPVLNTEEEDRRNAVCRSQRIKRLVKVLLNISTFQTAFKRTVRTSKMKLSKQAAKIPHKIPLLIIQVHSDAMLFRSAATENTASDHDQVFKALSSTKVTEGWVIL